MAQGTRLREIEEVPPAEAAGSAQTAENVSQRMMQAATAMLMQGLKTLSQRAIVALGNLVALAFVGSVFVLAWQVTSNPSPWQLGELSIYAVFILVALRSLK